MDVDKIIAQVDAEIATLKQARAVLTGVSRSPKPVRRKKRKLSPEGRARIVAALKRRWAAKKKAKS